MNLNEKKTIMEKFVKRLEKAIGREISVKKEIENDTATIKYLEEQKQAGTPIENAFFDNYDAWIDFVNKQIKRGQSTLANIEFKKIELEAVNYFLTKEE